MVNKYIEELLSFAVDKKLCNLEDVEYIKNRILEVLNISSYEKVEFEKREIKYPSDILDKIVEYAIDKNIINNYEYEKANLKAKIMDICIDKPSKINETFYNIYNKNKDEAFNYLYEFSKNSNYIQTDKIDKNIHFVKNTKFGDLQISINLSKPEKTIKEIEMMKNMKDSSTYPKTALSFDNEGSFATLKRDARQNLRIIRLNLRNSEWGFQYSPYIYYNEHSIVFSKKVTPMKIDVETIKDLISFLDFAPNYFIGSNAELPIVGGSILNHMHYQAGRHTFPIEKAEIIRDILVDNVKLEILKWPLTTIRLIGDSKDVVNISEKIINTWQTYSDYVCDIHSSTDNVRHNTITPIAKKCGEKYEVYLILRNNYTTKERPYGVFHAKEQDHNIKRENIGLIEAMGLAILPARLQSEMQEINQILRASLSLEDACSIMEETDTLKKHVHFLKTYFKEEMMQDDYIHVLYSYMGDVFAKILEECGVFKLDEVGFNGLLRFINKALGV